jgi:hypothetical protein
MISFASMSTSILEHPEPAHRIEGKRNPIEPVFARLMLREPSPLKIQTASQQDSAIDPWWFTFRTMKSGQYSNRYDQQDAAPCNLQEWLRNRNYQNSVRCGSQTADAVVGRREP